MPLDWRDTLRMLSKQFESLATKSAGLNHLFVEAADDEREKLSGPDWFKRSSKTIQILDGKPQYGKWDFCFMKELPTINLTFREPLPNEDFDVDSKQALRDRMGVVRAVSVPMKIRSGYYCGRPSDVVPSFESLANIAANAIANAQDLFQHGFASELTDIFRTPTAGVRYIFGDVPSVPTQFIAQGWRAGVLQFDSGVLIDLPVHEQAPDSSHWLLLLHRLGWHHCTGSGLRAERFAWEDNFELRLGAVDLDASALPTEFSKLFEKISKDSFYSVLGTKDAPLDINLASVFAIELLLADLKSNVPPPRSEQQKPIDYSRAAWKTLSIPQTRTVNRNAITDDCLPRIGVLVATEVERIAVLKQMRPPRNRRAILQIFAGNNTCFVGRLGLTDVVLCMTAMGSVNRDASTIVTAELIQSWNLLAIIMVGIAFGKDATKQEIGNVLVSDQIICYEPERIGTTSSEDRGNHPMAGTVLLNRFRNALGWHFYSPDGRQCGVQVGAILSGEKLVDDLEFKQNLLDRFPIAIGGEMEGAGVAAAAARNNREWILVKAICDWGDGTKTKHHQEFAAAASVDLVKHVFNQPGALDSLVHNVE